MLKVKIRKRLPSFELDVDLACDTGVTGIFGPSGSGKTTLLDCLAGVNLPDHGLISCHGEAWFDAGVRLAVHQRRIGYVFQDSLLFDHLTVRRNLEYGQRDPKAGPRFEDVAAMLEIEDLLERSPAMLSGGEQRRVALGRALLSNPRMLLLDEPLTGLDAELAGRVLVYLRRVLQACKLPTIYVSHSLSDIIYLCDDVIVLREGRVINRGDPLEVVTQTGVLEDNHVTDLRNVFEADVVSSDAEDHSIRCRVGDDLLTVYTTLLPSGNRVTLAIPACDIVIATQQPRHISARNALRGTVKRIDSVGSRLVALLDVGVPWMVEIGRAAVSELDLKPGVSVYAIVKATAVHVL